ncbi:MAG: hypothetical protein JXB47_03230 [Anaerolineae bacterium]|nr:hypothetical protein [Anaerolineae bacterium]
MRIRRAAVILSITVLAICGVMARAQDAGGAVTVIDAWTEIRFGEAIAFMIEVEAEAGVGAAEVIFQENGAAEAVVIPAVFEDEPGGAHRAAAILDLTRYALTPFARALYTWRITDRAGGAVEIDQPPLQYDDTRFDWQMYNRENIYLYAYDRPTAQVQAALNQAIIAQTRITQPLRLTMPASINIYLYNDAADLRSALTLHGRDAIEGYADPRHNVILLSAPPTYAELDLRRQLPHELAHIYIGHHTEEQAVPAWLVEGLALYFEAEPDPDLRAVFEEAAQNGALHPLEALCPAFPLDRQGFALAYAQSYEVVRYIERRYGPAGLRSLLDAYKEGASCRGGVAQGLGVALDALEHDWLLALDAGDSSADGPALWPWLVLLFVFAAWPAVFLTFTRRR